MDVRIKLTCRDGRRAHVSEVVMQWRVKDERGE